MKLQKLKELEFDHQDHLIYIPKTEERRVSHLQDLTSISGEQLARRFSFYDLVEEKAETVDFGSLLNKKERKEKISVFSGSLKRNFEHKSALLLGCNKKEKKKHDSAKKKLNKENLQIKFELNYLSKIKLNEIYSQHASVQTTARTKITNDDIKTEMYREFYMSSKFKSNQIPCVYMQTYSEIDSNKLMIYYHANGEDLLNSFNFVQALAAYFKLKVMVIEYPGYSIYSETIEKNFSNRSYEDSTKITEQEISEKILNDIPFVMSHIQSMGFKLENVIVIGRSMGSGPAIEISSKYPIGSLILLSPFSKFSEVTENLYGKFAGMVVKEPFDNFAKSNEIKCPVLIIHGLEDKTIHYSQSIQLSNCIKSYCQLKLLPNMTHNKFHFEYDIFHNIQLFLTDIDFHINM